MPLALIIASDKGRNFHLELGEFTCSDCGARWRERDLSRPYDLPSMTSLVVFEAAARRLSFKEAAAELNVTPAAVSHQIRGLEAELGRAVFLRQHRGVELTEAGAFLFVALQRGFAGMSEAVHELRGRAEAGEVVVQATTAVSAFWLTPQITAFWKTRPEIVVSQNVTDVEPPGGRPDLSIRYGPPRGEGEKRELFRDRILALGSPDYQARHRIARVEDLLEAPLIHLQAEGTDWTGWPDWFAALGRPAPQGRRAAVDNYMIALQLARDGAGAVLGWDGLVGDLLARRALVPLTPEAIPSPHAFVLPIPPRASAEARIFADWLSEGRG